MVEEYYTRLFIDLEMPEYFWSNLCFILMEYDYEYTRKSKLGLTQEVNLKKDMFIDKETLETFDVAENYDLHTLFGVIDEEEFVNECINLIVDEDIKEIVGN